MRHSHLIQLMLNQSHDNYKMKLVSSMVLKPSADHFLITFMKTRLKNWIQRQLITRDFR